MPKTNAGQPWEIGFRGSIRTSLPGWTVSNAEGKIMVRVRPQVGGKSQAARLPLLWTADNQSKATLLLNRAAKHLAGGNTDSLRDAITMAQGDSSTMQPALNWQEIGDGLRMALMSGRNEILESTWRDNYQHYVNQAIKLIDAGKASDGHTLLQKTLVKWKGKAASRAACCIALRNLTDHAIARHHAAACWRITPIDIKELKGKPPKKQTKATLEDSELLYLINGIEQRNPRWANVIRLLTLFGLRPIELQHLVPKTEDNGTLGLWCSYEKNCGGALTDPRWLRPSFLQDTDGSPIQWNLVGALHAGLLELPLGNDGQPRVLNGHYIEKFLKRQIEWIELKAKCTERGEWLRPYSFRDSYSLRCHRQKIEVGAVADAMGHSLEVHARSYRWASTATTAAAFAEAIKQTG